MSTPLYKNLPKEINKTARNLSEDHEDLVYCIGWHENKEWKEVEVASDFSVYPCCSLHAEHQLNDTYFDKKLDSMDKDWNNLKHNKLKDGNRAQASSACSECNANGKMNVRTNTTDGKSIFENWKYDKT